MNFYSHAAIASLFSTDAEIALGAMLPDFSSLIGARSPRSTCSKINRGYSLHYATDRAFHDAGPFRAACREESRKLIALGVGRGTALAAAHVGIELVLDDALMDDEPTRLLFRGALSLAASRCDSSALGWDTADQALRFETLRQRLWSLTTRGGAPGALALSERLCRTLAGRPRLAVRADDRAAIRNWAAELPLRCVELGPELVGSVMIGLEMANWQAIPALSRQLRFRRAQDSEL